MIRTAAPQREEAAGALVRAGAILFVGLGSGAAFGGIRIGVALSAAIVMLLPWHPRTEPRPDRGSHAAGWRLIGLGVALVGGGDAIGEVLGAPAWARVVLPGLLALPAVAVGLRWALTRRGRVHRLVLDALLISIGGTLLAWQGIWYPLVGDDRGAAAVFVGIAMLALTMGSILLLARGAQGMTVDRSVLVVAGLCYLGGAALVGDPEMVQRSWAAVLDGCGHVLAATAVVLGQRPRPAGGTVDAGSTDVVAAVRWPPTAIAIIALLSSIALAQQHVVPPSEVAENLQGALVLALAGRVVQAGRDWRSAWRRLETSVYTDEVTGLPNRLWLTDALPGLLKTLSVTGVLLVDVDRFKIVNDALGHHVGDQLLAVVGARLQELAGSGVVRSGGDEFLVLVDAAAGADPARLGEEIRRRLSAPVELGVHELRLTASVGVVTTASDSTAEELLRDVESALYQAKDGGRDRVVVMDDRMRRQARDSLRDEQALRTAAASGDLQFAYQPVVDASTGHVVQLRALISWDPPSHGSGGPQLLDLAKVDSVVGRPAWLLDVVGQALARLRRTPGWEGTAICLDVSPTRLRHPDFASQVRQALQAAGADPGKLVLAVPEDALTDPSGSQEGAVHALADLGIGIAVRSFGSGYTALGSLPSLPIQVLSLDASFTRRLGTSMRPSLVGIIIDMAHRLGMRVAAEGVQTVAQRAQLSQMGCDLVQGPHVGPAQPLEVLLATRPVAAPNTVVSTTTT